MCRLLTGLSGIKSLSFIFTLVLISFFSIGGCSENNGGTDNGGGVGALPPQVMCTTDSPACTGITSDTNNTVICDSLADIVCAVDLNAVIAEVDPDGTLGVTGDTVMWIEAWGANGGNSPKGTSGAEGGYAVTTTTVNDVKSKNSGSSVIYYFLGTSGLEPAERCGGGGGVSTIVTTEDLVLNPNSNPTQSSPPVLLVAGGGGGGAAANLVGACLTSSKNTPGAGGEAFATMQADGQGPGGSSDGPSGGVAAGGNLDGMGMGGGATSNDPGESAGSDGYGGLGGVGGRGPDCEGFGADGFSNTPVGLGMTTGLGGNGGGRTGSCAAGGGAGGGGYGGGGGGSHGNESIVVVAGGGGGSFAIQSTKSSRQAPTTKQFNPCGTEGCVRITFAP